MVFSDADIRPNGTIPLAAVRVSSVGDARWRGVPKRTRRIDTLQRMLLARKARQS